MSIEKKWGETGDPMDDDLSSLLQTGKLSKLTSHNPLEKIRKNLLINMIWGILICGLYVWLIFNFHFWQVQLAVIIVLLFSLWAVYTAFQQYKNMETTISNSSSLLVEMKRHYQSITDWMHLQQRVALFIYPVSAAGGFMLGGASGSGKPIAVLMSKPVFLIALLIALAVLVPACHFLTKWLFKISFGKHLKALKMNIEALEEEK
jgi:hypothetical protein